MTKNRDLPRALQSRIVPGWDPLADLECCVGPFLSAAHDHFDDMVTMHGPFNGDVLDRIDAPMLCIEGATMLHMRGIMWNSRLTAEREGTVRMGIVDAMVHLPVVRGLLIWGGIRLPSSPFPMDASLRAGECELEYKRYVAALRRVMVPAYSDWSSRWFLPGLRGERSRDRRAGLLRDIWTAWAEAHLLPLQAKIPFMRGLCGVGRKKFRRVPFRAVKERMLANAGGSEAYAVELALRFLASKDGGLLVGEDGLVHPNYGVYYDHVAGKVRREYARRKKVKTLQLDEANIREESPGQRSAEDDAEEQRDRLGHRLTLLAHLESLEQLGKVSQREIEMIQRSLALGFDYEAWGSRQHHRSVVADGFKISQPGLLKMAKRVRRKLKIAV